VFCSINAINATKNSILSYYYIEEDNRLCITKLREIFEIYEESFKNESGFIPVIIKLEPEEKKLKKSIN